MCVRERVGRREIDRKMPGNRRRKQEEDAVGGMEEEKDNPMCARWNENAVTRNKRGDPKLLVEVQSEGLGMSLRDRKSVV